MDSYELLGGSINWSEVSLGKLPGTFRLMLWGKNLLDEEYSTYSIRAWEIFGATKVVSFGDQRTYGLTVTYNY